MDSFIDQAIQEYAEVHTKKGDSLLEELNTETKREMECPQMLSGHLSGRFLKLITQLSGAKVVLEIGLFTGYSALCFAEALPEDGRVISCDVDEKSAMLARKYFAKSDCGNKVSIKLGPALDTISKIQELLDLVFIDADKENYKKYYEAVLPRLRPGGLILVDNCLWSGRVLQPQTKDDLAIHALNELVARDERVENVIIPIRDGVNLIRKK